MAHPACTCRMYLESRNINTNCTYNATQPASFQSLGYGHNRPNMVPRPFQLAGPSQSYAPRPQQRIFRPQLPRSYFAPRPNFRAQTSLWALGRTPINVSKLQELLLEYPKKSDATFLSGGFQSGFKLNFKGPRIPIDCNNLKSIKDNPEIAKIIIMHEVKLGRIASPFTTKPISYMRYSPTGLVAKKAGGYKLIKHLSHPPGLSVYEHIDDAFASVK